MPKVEGVTSVVINREGGSITLRNVQVWDVQTTVPGPNAHKIRYYEIIATVEET